MLGLGEAGSRLAADLAVAGADVRGYDPAASSGAPGVRITADAGSAVDGADLVLSVNTAKVALSVAATVLPAIGTDAAYADLNTGSPELKRALAGTCAQAGLRFADVALLGPVPRKGLRTPALASGSGAQAFADAIGQLGMPVEVVSDEAGDAAAMKLLRSVFMKGLAAAAIESVAAAEVAGHADWLKREIAAVIGKPFLERLLEGSRRHAARRVDEMEAARGLLLSLGVEPRIAGASAEVLAGLASARRES